MARSSVHARSTIFSAECHGYSCGSRISVPPIAMRTTIQSKRRSNSGASSTELSRQLRFGVRRVPCLITNLPIDTCAGEVELLTRVFMLVFCQHVRTHGLHGFEISTALAAGASRRWIWAERTAARCRDLIRCHAVLDPVGHR